MEQAIDPATYPTVWRGEVGTDQRDGYGRKRSEVVRQGVGTYTLRANWK